MNIKSLLLGSAAVFAVAGAAHAADAIIAAEPEPLEYVRICDAYGAGYFYIPGSETCLKISGKVRSDNKWYDAKNAASQIGTYSRTRAEVGLDTATDTDYGALKTNTVMRFEWLEGTATVKLLWANISLGGFTVGLQDSQYNKFIGYAGNVNNDDVIYDGPYELNQLTYLYDAGNGFTAVVSLEDTKSDANSTAFGAGQKGEADHYAPNVVAGVGYKAGNFGFKLVGGYDSIVEEGAIKARVDADFGVFKAFLMGGWNTDGGKLNQYAGSNMVDNGAACPKGRGDLCGWGDWAVWTGVTVPFNAKLSANAQFAYTDSKILAVAANVQWKPIKDLTITPEISYTDWDSVDKDQLAGWVRVDRKF